MLAFIGSAVLNGTPVALVSVDVEAVVMYGLVALVIGLIGWSKYSEPPLSDPYAVARSDGDLTATTGDSDVGPVVVTVPVSGERSPPPGRP